MKIISNHLKLNERSHRTSCKLLLTILLFSILTLPASATVTDFQISPEYPAPGDTITITGNASTGESIKAVVSFTKTVTATGDAVGTAGKRQYEYNVGSVEIPSKPNRFTVVAKTVDEVHVSVQKLGITLITLSKDSVGGTATISQSDVFPGTYKILIGGFAEGGTSVNLEISAEKTITADQNGNFEYSASTSSIPVGDFILKVGSKTKTISLGTTPPEDDPIDDTSGFILNPIINKIDQNIDTLESDADEENEQNILLTELFSKKVNSGDMVVCEFNNSSNPLKFINFTSNMNYDNLTISVKILHSTSTLVKKSPSNNVYMNLNIGIGDNGSANIINSAGAKVDFTVDKDWIESNNIDPSTIVLLHYNDSSDSWDVLQTEQIGDSDNELYYRALALEFSPFAIVGDKNQIENRVVQENEKTPVNNETAATTDMSNISSTSTQILWLVLFACIGIAIIFLILRRV